MSEAIRVLHFGDVHVGMENYGRIDPATGTSTRVRDFLDRLDEVIDYALAQDADLAIFAGDAFKNRDPEPTQQREFARRIKRLADAMPTFLLVGNHDMPAMAAKASSVDIFHALDVPGVMVGQKPGWQVVETRRGPLFLAWMPYPMRNRLLSREEHVGKSIEELELALREAVGTILRDLTAQAEQHDMPRILVGHFSVAEAKLGSERSVMLGRDVPVNLSALADPSWDYVALGHIHRHQLLNPGAYPPVVYCGSLERIDFGEEKEDKGFCWVSLARQQTSFQFVPVAARPFTTLELDLREAEDPTGAALAALQAHSLAGHVVRLRLRLLASQEPALREGEIHAALGDVASLTIQKDIQQEARLRLHDLAPESLTPLELLRRYYESRKEDPQRLQALLQKAEALIRDTR